MRQAYGLSYKELRNGKAFLSTVNFFPEFQHFTHLLKIQKIPHDSPEEIGIVII